VLRNAVQVRSLRAIAVVLAIETRYSRTEFLNENVRKTPSSSIVASVLGFKRGGRRVVQYLLIFIACVLVIDAIVGEKGLLEMVKKRQEFRALEQSLTDSRSENTRLRDEAKRLREDPDAIEDIARRQLGLIKPGEKLFIVKDVDPATR
jgi:cell division protein FtsB